MERDRKFRIIAVLALIVAIAGVSVGFAAFNETLTINSTASITPTDTFEVRFGNSNGSVVSTETIVEGVGSGSATGSAKLNADGVVTDITANFVNPGDSVTFTFYTTNNSNYLAYLNNITFAEIAPICAAAAENGATAAIVTNVCDDMKISIAVDDTTTSNYANLTNTDITDKTIAAKVGATMSSDTVVLTLTYDAAGDYADGGITVDYGAITIGYSTAD